MTIVIGMTVSEGALLVADCLNKATSGGTLFKIDPAIYEGNKVCISGAYLGKAGHYTFVDAAEALCSNYLYKAPNRADGLSNPLLNQHNSEYFDQLKKQKEQERDSFENSKNFALAELVEKEIEKLSDLFELSLLLHDTGEPSPGFYFSRIVLRLSENYQPDLFAINGKVRAIETFQAVGSGAKIVEPYLIQNYSPDLNLDQATSLAAQAMNVALADSTNFQGYQLVRARKNKGVNVVETAVDLNASIMPLNFSRFLDYRFRTRRN